MIIKELDNKIKWKIKPQFSNKYQKVKSKIEAFSITINTYMPSSVVDLTLAEMPELILPQLEAGWPLAVPPSHEYGWPQSCEPHPSVHGLTIDSESYLFDLYNTESNDSDD
jgi:hypothetical protein